MVSYTNNFGMYPKYHGSNLPYGTSPGWYPSHYHQPPNHSQFMTSDNGVDSPQGMYYAHPSIYHHQSSPDWSGHDNFTPPQTTLLQSTTPNSTSGGAGGGLHINPQTQTEQFKSEHILNDGLHSVPSPPITVSGSDMSSPGVPNGSSSPHNTTSRPAQVKSPYEWIKRQSYQNQPNPGKTRTKDKYRVVYTDQQRLELEKEFHYSRYITIRRKTELAQTLQLSERQVKIWFQNRRAKDRKQKKKTDNGLPGQTLVSHSQHNPQSLSSSLLVDTKPKLEPGLQFPHLHQMSALSAMGMGSMGLHAAHHHHALHQHLSHVTPGGAPPPPTSQHLNPGPQVSSASLNLM
uniref:Putative caudal n=1 Tax=Corethrella appendiculata TaxID=1370023 RepID=U5EZN0_9DIPT